MAPSVVYAYYYNALIGYADPDSLKTIVEIGAGNGNLASVLKQHLPGRRYVIVDLPETICLSIIFLKDLFPSARILMPHEAAQGDWQGQDFIFLTPAQTGLIKDASIDLVVQIDGFQEMTRAQVEFYFKEIQRITKDGSYVLAAGRAEKIATGSDADGVVCGELPCRFNEYPWPGSSEVLIHEYAALTGLFSWMIVL